MKREQRVHVASVARVVLAMAMVGGLLAPGSASVGLDEYSSKKSAGSQVSARQLSQAEQASKTMLARLQAGQGQLGFQLPASGVTPGQKAAEELQSKIRELKVAVKPQAEVKPTPATVAVAAAGLFGKVVEFMLTPPPDDLIWTSPPAYFAGKIQEADGRGTAFNGYSQFDEHFGGNIVSITFADGRQSKGAVTANKMGSVLDLTTIYNYNKDSVSMYPRPVEPRAQQRTVATLDRYLQTMKVVTTVHDGYGNKLVTSVSTRVALPKWTGPNPRPVDIVLTRETKADGSVTTMTTTQYSDGTIKATGKTVLQGSPKEGYVEETTFTSILRNGKTTTHAETLVRDTHWDPRVPSLGGLPPGVLARITRDSVTKGDITETKIVEEIAGGLYIVEKTQTETRREYGLTIKVVERHFDNPNDHVSWDDMGGMPKEYYEEHYGVWAGLSPVLPTSFVEQPIDLIIIEPGPITQRK